MTHHCLQGGSTEGSPGADGLQQLSGSSPAALGSDYSKLQDMEVELGLPHAPSGWEEDLGQDEVEGEAEGAFQEEPRRAKMLKGSAVLGSNDMHVRVR
jgi:hypothetical protein